MKELPGIEQPEDVGQIIEDGERLPGYGEYDLIIGDNPNGQHHIVLRVVDGLVITASVVETFPDAEYGEHSDERADDRTVLYEEQWRHTQNSHRVTKEEIRETIKNPDEVWVSETSQGQDWYMWVKLIEGEVVVVRGARVNDEVRIGTSFRPDRGEQYVNDWVEMNDGHRIFP